MTTYKEANGNEHSFMNQEVNQNGHSEISKNENNENGYHEIKRNYRERSPSRRSHRDYRDREYRSREYRDRPRSRSRSRRYHRSSRRRSPSYDRYYRSHRRRSRSRERSRRRSRSRDRYRKPSPFRPPEMSLAEQMEQLDRTVGVHGLHPRCTEKHLMEFFQRVVGKAVNAKVVRDNKTGVSKCIGYVEFEDFESMELALKLPSSEMLMGQHLTTHRTDNEKNLVLHQMSLGNLIPKPKEKKSLILPVKREEQEVTDQPRRIYVSQLHPQITKDSLRKVFEPFGPLESVSLFPPPNEGLKSFAYLEFKFAQDAKKAYDNMNGFNILGENIRVGWARGEKTEMRYDDQNRNKYEDDDYFQQEGTQLQARDDDILKTRNCILRNMFNPKEETEPNWDKELELDVADECQQFGNILHIFVDREAEEGLIYMRFETADMCEKAVKNLNGRWFAKRKIECEFLLDSFYNAKFPDLLK